MNTQDSHLTVNSHIQHQHDSNNAINRPRSQRDSKNASPILFTTHDGNGSSEPGIKRNNSSKSHSNVLGKIKDRTGVPV